jgi:hypothetical protein
MKSQVLLWLLTTLIILLGIFRACLGFNEPWVLKLKDLKPKHPNDK